MHASACVMLVIRMSAMATRPTVDERGAAQKKRKEKEVLNRDPLAANQSIIHLARLHEGSITHATHSIAHCRPHSFLSCPPFSSDRNPIMSKAAAKLAKVREDRDALFAAGKHYEALQLYKTLVSRSRARKAWDDAAETAVDGAKALLQHGQSASGGELALALVELYAKSGAQCGPDQLRTLLPLSSAFPASDSGREAQIAFLKSAIKWSSSVAPAGSAAGAGCPDLHLALARVYRAQKDYPAAHQQYLRSGDASELGQLSLPMDAAAATPSWLGSGKMKERLMSWNTLLNCSDQLPDHGRQRTSQVKMIHTRHCDTGQLSGPLGQLSSSHGHATVGCTNWCASLPA